MAGPQVDDPDELCGHSQSGPTEREIMRDYYSTFPSCDFQEIGVRPTDKPLIPNRAQIVPTVVETGDDGGSDVFVCEERELERLHAVIRRSQVRSPRSAFAA